MTILRRRKLSIPEWQKATVTYPRGRYRLPTPGEVFGPEIVERMRATGDEPETWISGLWHLDGVTFDDAPRPPEDHQCWAQTIIDADVTKNGDEMPKMERCPCGGYRYPNRTYNEWGNRNTRGRP